MKRIMILILAAALLMSGIPTSFAQTMPTLRVDTVTAEAGQTVDVNIRLLNNPGVISVKLSLEYDPMLELREVTVNEELQEYFLCSQENRYPVILNWCNGSTELTEDAVFVTLTFQIARDADPGVYPISISYDADDVFDFDEKNVAFAIENGGVNVISRKNNGICKGDDGNFYYYIDDEIQVNYTGLLDNGVANWYIVNGQVQLTFRGMAAIGEERYMISGGKVKDFNGLSKQNGQWLYFVDGRVAKKYTGVVAHLSTLTYVVEGEVDFSSKALREYNGELYYIKYGIWSSGFTGLLKDPEGVWRYVSKGKVDTTYTGFAKNELGWFYVENGLIDTTFHGFIEFSGSTYYVKWGQVMLNTTGIVTVKGTKYYVKSGAWQYFYTGVYTDTDGVEWNVTEGIVR